MSTFIEETISSEMIYHGRILNLRKDQVKVIGGKTSDREIIEHSGGVTIIGITDEGKVPLVKQFRKPAEKVVMELPAGKLEKGEDPLKGAIREFKEETGYTAGKIRLLTSFYCAIGYSTEIIYLYLAQELSAGNTDFDETEAIDNVEYDLGELKRMVMAGEIEDGKTIAGVMMADAALNL